MGKKLLTFNPLWGAPKLEPKTRSPILFSETRFQTMDFKITRTSLSITNLSMQLQLVFGGFLAKRTASSSSSLWLELVLALLCMAAMALAGLALAG